MRIGVLGTGTIASAVVDGIAGDGHQITVSRRGAAHSARLAARHPGLAVAGNQAVVDASDVVFLGATAEAAPAMLEPLRFRAGQKVISLMVGIGADVLAGLLAPARLETVMIPFPSIAHGGSPVLVHPASPVAEALFGARNTVLALGSAAAFNDYLAAQAVLSPVVTLLATAVRWLGARSGDAATAERFLRLLVGGSILAGPLESDGALAALLAALDTPGGLNRQLREHMAARGAYAELEAGLEMLARRMAEDAE